MNGNAATNPITIRPIFAGDTIQFGTGYTISSNYGAVQLIYNQLANDYQVVSNR